MKSHMQTSKFFKTAAVTLALGLSSIAWADSAVEATSAKVKAALASDVRTAADKSRDLERKPLETLAFFGLKDNMRVLELSPGGGWYTKILGNVLRDKGELYLAMGLKYLGNGLNDWGYDHVKVISDDNVETAPTSFRGISDVKTINLPLRDLDMVLTFRNAHNFTEDARRKIDKAVFDSLKPGGIYGVVDHTRRHMEPAQQERWRRIDPVEVILEATQAGFEFVGYSDLHRNPADMLIHDSTHESLNRYSDRFTLKFRKPL